MEYAKAYSIRCCKHRLSEVWDKLAVSPNTFKTKKYEEKLFE